MKKWIMFIFLLLIVTILPPLSYGQEAELTITVYPGYPDNQSPDHQGYYHLEVEGG